MPAGAAAQIDGHGLAYLMILGLFSGLGRIAGASVLYFLADKSEDLIFGQGKKVFGLTHKQVEQFGNKLSGKVWRDWLLLFTMNALPIFPGALLSVACGFVRVRFKTFITATFFGTLINALFYLYIGYAGLQTARLINDLQLISMLFAAGFLVTLIIFALIHLRKSRYNKH